MKEVAIIFNDTHIKLGNEEAVITSVKHLIEYAVKHKIKNLIFAGDLVHSRSFQRLSVLVTIDTILKLAHDAGLTIHSIPGNHDKSVYKDIDNFQDVFTYYPALKLYRDTSYVTINGVSFCMLPFFDEQMLVKRINEAKKTDVLIGHFEMNGSTNLGHVSEGRSINKKMLSKFKKTYLGHYHNWNEISKDIVHLPSLRPMNFGEDNNKGFTVLYEDLSYKVIEGKFKKYIKETFDIDKVEVGYIKGRIESYKDSKDAIRFELTGESDSLKIFDKSIFKGSGINVMVKYESKYGVDDIIPSIVKEYDENIIKNVFEEFCTEKSLDHKEGLELLNKFLNKDKDE
jgi:exonuclease SbcD